MKISDIKKAYGSVRADSEMKAAILRKAEELSETEDNSEEFGEMSRIEIKKGGGIRRPVNAFGAIAAVFAVIFALIYAAETGHTDNKQPDIIMSVPADEPLPSDTAEVPVKLLDENGILLKNLRIDYFPVKYDVQETDSSSWGGLSGGNMIFDEEHSERIGTIPVTCEDEQILRIHYGTYYFIISDALPNDTFQVYNTTEKTGDGRVIFDFGFAGNSAYLRIPAMTVIDENTTVIEIMVQSALLGADPNVSPAEIILTDADGDPMRDLTVILKPINGVMAEGYSDIYGGYVLPRTDKNGSTAWKYPIEGEYTVIAYREKLHTADVPVTEPFIFDGDDTFAYVKKEGVLPSCKIYRQMPLTD